MPNKTISKVKSIFLMEGEVHTATSMGGFFTGLFLEMEDGRILKQHSTDVIQPFAELKPENESYEQIKALFRRD